MFTYKRNEIDLDGIWKFNPDPYMRCRQQSWWKGEGPDDGFFPCFNLEGLWDIEVPGTWKCQFEELKWYDGHANYVREFTLDQIPEDMEAFLCFDGVTYASSIYLNGMHVGDHDWGYSPFQMRVTGLLRQTNRLFVLVDNIMREDRVPGIRCDWNNDGGITGGVKLIFVPRTYIENFRTETRLEGDEAVIKVEAWLQNSDTSVSEEITFEIPELGVKTAFTAKVGEKASAEIRVPVAGNRSVVSGDRSPTTDHRSPTTDHRSPTTDHHTPITLWSPENPKLYETRLSTRYETVADEIGYREIRTEGTQILLNGEPIRLYGVAVHSEFPETGRAATPEGIELMLKKARELGVNFLRCAHYPYADIFARAMDRAGMLWWEEVPVYWLPHVHEEPQRSLALGMLKDMIVRDWNRASLIFWSVSNECAGDGEGSDTLEAGNYPYWVEACKLVRELDPSRLISSADSGHRRTEMTEWTPDKGDAFDENHQVETWHPGHPDEFYELLDVLGANLYVGQLGGNPVATHKFVDMLRRFNKPLMITEFGSMSTTDPNPEKPENVIGQPQYHETILREGYQAFHECPEIIGYVPWCLMDVRVPMHWRWYNRGSGTFAYGLLDNDYNEKPAFSVVQDEIAKLKERFDR